MTQLLSQLQTARVHVKRTGAGRLFVPLGAACDAGRKNIFGPGTKRARARLYIDPAPDGSAVLTAAGRQLRFRRPAALVAFARRYLEQPVFLMSSVPGAWAYQIGDAPPVTGKVPGASEEAALLHGVRHVLVHAAARHYSFGIATHGATASAAPSGAYFLQDGLRRLPVWRANDFRCGLARRVPAADVWRDVSALLLKAHEHQIYFLWVRGRTSSKVEQRLKRLKASIVGDKPKWNRSVSLNRQVPFYSVVHERKEKEKREKKREKKRPLGRFEWDAVEEDAD